MKKIIFIIFIFFFIFIGCSIPDVNITKNEIEGYTIYDSPKCSIYESNKPIFLIQPICGWLLFEKIDYIDKKEKYFIIINYAGFDWIFIPEGKTLTFVLDKKRFDYWSKGSREYRDVSGSIIIETAFYPCEKQDFLNIITAKEYKAQLKGDKVFIDFEIKNMEYLKKFYDKYCK